MQNEHLATDNIQQVRASEMGQREYQRGHHHRVLRWVHRVRACRWLALGQVRGYGSGRPNRKGRWAVKRTHSIMLQWQRQGCRCYWCQALTLPENLTREHLYPKKNQQRNLFGGEWVLAHNRCNLARGGLTLGSIRFNKWIRRVMRGQIESFHRPDNCMVKT